MNIWKVISIFLHQSGSRSLHSVVTSLLNNTNEWHINEDNRNYTAMVFIDLKKGFDSVSHHILLAKQKEYVVCGLEYQWFQSCLEIRLQFCTVNGAFSDLHDIGIGVPQGSCLGPLLFLIDINDLSLALSNYNLTIYADDISISYASKNIEELHATLNSDLECLNKWLQGNKFSLNVIKTQAMVIASKPILKKIIDKKEDAPFFIGGSEINLESNLKYLSV